MEWLRNCLVVGLGGSLGTIGRYLLGLLPLPGSSGFPFITLGINILGSFAIGVVMAYAGKAVALAPSWVLFLKVGVCGGFTTFSAFSLEAMGLLQNGQFLLALCYIVLSVLLCLCAVWAAQTLMA